MLFESALFRLFRLSRPAKRGIQVLADSILIIGCFFAAMTLRLESLRFVDNPRVWMVLVPVLPISIIAFVRLGLYRAVVRYITSKALGTLLTGVFVSSATMLVFSQMFNLPIPRSVPLIYAVLMLISVGGVRFALRAAFNRSQVRNKDHILIYGAGEAGRQLLRALSQGPEYLPVAFIDNDPALQKTEVGGLNVKSLSQVPKLLQAHDIKAILLAVPSAPRTRRNEIVKELATFGVEVKTMPGIADIVSGKAKISDLRTVPVEDLLGRDPVPPYAGLMSTNITGKTVLISGAGGSIGSELCRQILEYMPASLILFDVSEFALYKIDDELQTLAQSTDNPASIIPILGSVQNFQKISAILKRFRVDTIYHAAAYKHVPLVEQNVVEGIRNNVFGTYSIARAAVSAGVKSFTLISTDKAVRPTNIMGTTKRVAELICQALGTEQDHTTFSMVRFGNVLGSSGSVIPRFRAQIESGGPVTITHPEITRYFMTIPEAAQLVIQAGAMAKGGDVFVLDMGEPVKIADLADRMVRLHGLIPYFSDSPDNAPTAGDIALTFTGLRPGEKLYEELLIGNDPAATQHPRIMKATEAMLAQPELAALLDGLKEACRNYDIERIRSLLLAAPAGFEPSDEIADLVWVDSRKDASGSAEHRQTAA